MQMLIATGFFCIAKTYFHPFIITPLKIVLHNSNQKVFLLDIKCYYSRVNLYLKILAGLLTGKQIDNVI